MVLGQMSAVGHSRAALGVSWAVWRRQQLRQQRRCHADVSGCWLRRTSYTCTAAAGVGSLQTTERPDAA